MTLSPDILIYSLQCILLQPFDILIIRNFHSDFHYAQITHSCVFSLSGQVKQIKLLGKAQVLACSTLEFELEGKSELVSLVSLHNIT